MCHSQDGRAVGENYQLTLTKMVMALFYVKKPAIIRMDRFQITLIINFLAVYTATGRSPISALSFLRARKIRLFTVPMGMLRWSEISLYS